MASRLTNFNGGQTTLAKVPQLLKLISNTKRSLLLCGAPGMGKSAIIYEYSQNNKLKLFVFTGGLITRNNIYGVDFIDPNTKSSIHYPAEWFVQAMQHDGKVILFLDDFANAKPQEMMILQQILGDRKLGNYDLPVDKFLIVAATNRQVDNSNVYAMSNAILNRCSVVQVNIDPLEFLEYAKDKFHPSVYSFLESRHWALSDDVEYLEQNKVPAEAMNYGASEAANAVVHPSARTWMGVSDMLYSLQVDVLSDEHIGPFTSLVDGFIGSGLSPMFIRSLRTTLNIPSMQTLINNCNDKVDYRNLISSDHEAVSSVIFTLYQEVTKRLETYRQLKADGTLKPTMSPKGRPMFTYKPITDILDVMNKLRETDFTTINSNVLISSIFDLFCDTGKDSFTDLLELLNQVTYFKEFVVNKSRIENAK